MKAEGVGHEQKNAQKGNRDTRVTAGDFGRVRETAPLPQTGHATCWGRVVHAAGDRRRALRALGGLVSGVTVSSVGGVRLC